MSWVNNIEVAFVNSYHANLEFAFQQKRARLRRTVQVGSQNSEFDFWDRIGTVEANEVIGRHGDTPLNETPYDRRRIQMTDYDWADLIDRPDKLRMLADPTSSYVINARNALNRSMDRAIINAALGNAYAGKTGEEVVPLPASQKIPVDYADDGAGASSNLTLAKLRRVIRVLRENEVIDDEGENEDPAMIYGVITAAQLDAMLRTTEITNVDYNTVKALAEGRVNTFMGIKFIYTQLLPVTADVRQCLFYVKPAMRLSVGAEAQTDVGPRRDKRLSVQVYAASTFGASRMWEEGVLQVDCDETQ